MDQMVALVHHAYLAWAAGRVTIPLERETLDAMLGEGGIEAADAAGPRPPTTSSSPSAWSGPPWSRTKRPEPLDGLFVSRAPAGDLRVLGIFGLRPDRAGFSAVEAIGPRAEGLAREDGSALFDPTLPGAARGRAPIHRGRGGAARARVAHAGAGRERRQRRRVMETLKDFMDKKAVADVLEQIAAFLELRGRESVPDSRLPHRGSRHLGLHRRPAPGARGRLARLGQGRRARPRSRSRPS